MRICVNVCVACLGACFSVCVSDSLAVTLLEDLKGLCSIGLRPLPSLLFPARDSPLQVTLRGRGRPWGSLCPHPSAHAQTRQGHPAWGLAWAALTQGQEVASSVGPGATEGHKAASLEAALPRGTLGAGTSRSSFLSSDSEGLTRTSCRGPWRAEIDGRCQQTASHEASQPGQRRLLREWGRGGGSPGPAAASQAGAQVL